MESLKKERLVGAGGPIQPLAISMLAAAEQISRTEAVSIYNKIHPAAIEELMSTMSKLIEGERSGAIEDLIEVIRTMMDEQHHVLVGEAVAVSREIESGAAHPHEAAPRPVG